MSKGYNIELWYRILEKNRLSYALGYQKKQIELYYRISEKDRLNCEDIRKDR